MTNQPCIACGWTLRFVPERDGWGCDRCHSFVPRGAPLPPPSASPWAPPGGSAAVTQATGAPSAYAPPVSPVSPVSPYAPPPPGAPPAPRYTPQPYSPHPVPPPGFAPPAPAAQAPNRKRLWLLGGGVAAVLVISVLAVVLSRGGGGASSRRELVDATFAALAAGDVEQLVKLVDPQSLFDRVLDCRDAVDDDVTPRELEREFRERAGRLADKVKGRKLEVIGVETLDRDSGDGRAYGGRDRGVYRKGDKVFGGCRAKETFRAHDVIVTVEETRRGKKPRKKAAKLELLEVEGDWYLVDAPRGRQSGDIPALGDDAYDGDPDDMLDKIREFKDEMCRCRDRACASRVTDAMTKWGKDVMDRDRNAAKVSPRAETLTKELADCMMKAMAEE